MAQSLLTAPTPEPGWLTSTGGLSTPAPRRLLTPPPTVGQGQDLGTLGLVAGGAFALWLWNRNRDKGDVGDVLEPPVGPQAARVSGSIGATIRASQVAPAGQIAKDIGGPAVNVRFAWFGRTTTADGTAISWPYAILTRLGHNTVFGWRQAFPDLNFPSTTGQTLFFQSVQGETARSTFFLVPDDSDQVWDFRVWLFALRSDENGLPVGDPRSPIANNQSLTDKVQNVGPWMGVAFGQLPGAFRSVKPSLSASVSGSLGIITAQQGPRRRIGSLQRSTWAA